MRLWHFVVFSCFFMAAANAALPQEYTGREHSEAILLLSQSDFDVRLAAKSLNRLSSNRQDILDLLAEVTRTACSGNRKMNPDTLSWLAKALGNTKQARYAGLLDYCLANVTGKNTIKHLKQARDSLEGTTTDSFEGGKIDLEQMRARLLKKAGPGSLNQVAKRFGEVLKGQSLDEVYSILGTPNDVSGVNVPKGRAGRGSVQIRLSEDMIVFAYSGSGTIRFSFDDAKDKNNWLLTEAKSDKGLIWKQLDGKFVTINELIKTDLITTGDASELREIVYHLRKQESIGRDILDRSADRIYRSRLEPGEELADALAWLCKIIAKSGDGRYKQLLLEVSNTATNNKLRKYASKAANDLPEDSEEQYVPSPS